MVHRLSDGDVTKHAMIWEMAEEEVQMALYLRRVDRVSEKWGMLT